MIYICIFYKFLFYCKTIFSKLLTTESQEIKKKKKDSLCIYVCTYGVYKIKEIMFKYFKNFMFNNTIKHITVLLKEKIVHKDLMNL